MKQHKLLQKLLDQHTKHGKLIVAYDFDDTVYPFSLSVEELKDTVELIKELDKQGHFVYCYTSNEDMNKVTSYLYFNKIPYKSINKSLVESSGKQFYNVLLDDKAGLNEVKEVLRIFLGMTSK